jgi:hypothetical protein
MKSRHGRYNAAMTENGAAPPQEPPGNVIAELRVEAGADVIPGPETLRRQEEARRGQRAPETDPGTDY